MHLTQFPLPILLSLIIPISIVTTQPISPKECIKTIQWASHPSSLRLIANHHTSMTLQKCLKHQQNKHILIQDQSTNKDRSNIHGDILYYITVINCWARDQQQIKEKLQEIRMFTKKRPLYSLIIGQQRENQAFTTFLKQKYNTDVQEALLILTDFRTNHQLLTIKKNTNNPNEPRPQAPITKIPSNPLLHPYTIILTTGTIIITIIMFINNLLLRAELKRKNKIQRKRKKKRTYTPLQPIHMLNKTVKKTNNNPTLQYLMPHAKKKSKKILPQWQLLIYPKKN